MENAEEISGFWGGGKGSYFYLGGTQVKWRQPLAGRRPALNDLRRARWVTEYQGIPLESVAIRGTPNDQRIPQEFIGISGPSYNKDHPRAH